MTNTALKQTDKKPSVKKKVQKKPVEKKPEKKALKEAVAKLSIIEPPVVQPVVVQPIEDTTSVVGQIRTAFKAENRLATVSGFLLGGFVPLGIYIISHNELTSIWEVNMLLVLGGLIYSASTVYQWGKLAFDSGWKAFGFLVLIEGIMILSSTTWLGVTALVYLVMINGIGTGVNIALKKGQSK